MVILFIIIGVILGVWIAEEEGFLFGAVCGYLIGEAINLRRRVKQLESQVQQLSRSPAPLTDSTTSTEPEQPPVPVQSPAPHEPVAAEQLVEHTPVPQPAPSVISTTEQADSASSDSLTVQDQWNAAPPGTPSDNVVWKWIRNYFTTGNTLVRVGVIILFFGVAFLAKYAAEKGVLPIEVRIIAIALGGLAMLVFGWRLRNKKSEYALALQGGGIGIVYLTIFAALRLFKDHNLLPPGLAFVLLLVVCVLSAFLAVLQNSRALAILGSSGGFLAPVLASTGSGSHVMLFTYYALLNAGILGVAWYKSWRLLNLIGFSFTFIIGSAWGFKNYKDELFTTTEPFLILFFLFYVAISVLYALRQPIKLRGYIDGTLVFGTPIIAFTLQFLLVRKIEFALAYSAIALCIFYVLLAYGIFKYVANYDKNDGIKLICQSFLAIGIVFGTVAIPLAVDDQWTSAAWALEGCALIWVAIRQHRLLPFASGIVLQAGAAIFVAKALTHAVHGQHLAVINGAFISAILVGVAGLLSAYFIFHGKSDYKYYRRNMEWIAFVWGMVWWFFSGVYEIDHHSLAINKTFWLLAYCTSTVIVCQLLGQKYEWPQMSAMHRTLIVFLVISALTVFDGIHHPFANYTGIMWLYSFAAYYWLLKQNETEPLDNILSFLHGAGTWFFCALLSWESHWWISQRLPESAVWPWVSWLTLPAIVLMFHSRAHNIASWPFRQHKQLYLEYVCTPLACYLVLAMLFGALLSSGNAAPLPYVPLLNPLDLALAFTFICVIGWLLILRKENMETRLQLDPLVIHSILAALVFLMLNSALIRTIHHWYNVPLDFSAMLHSDIAQTSLTLFWTIIAMTTMIFASRKHHRTIWIVGAALIAIVVLKLFTIDLANIGTIQRIISFIGVGVLMLIIGYFTPLPPKKKVVANV